MPTGPVGTREANGGAPPEPGPSIRWEWLHFGALTSVQVHDMLQLRQDVFVLEQRCLYRDIDGLDIGSWHGLGTTREGELVACARLIPPDEERSEPAIGRVAVARPWRSKGLGRALMLTAIAEARARYPGRDVRVNAQAYLERFYAELGFEGIGDVYDDDGIPHRKMRLRPQ